MDIFDCERLAGEAHQAEVAGESRVRYEQRSHTVQTVLIKARSGLLDERVPYSFCSSEHIRLTIN